MMLSKFPFKCSDTVRLLIKKHWKNKLKGMRFMVAKQEKGKKAESEEKAEQCRKMSLKFEIDGVWQVP